MNKVKFEGDALRTKWFNITDEVLRELINVLINNGIMLSDIRKTGFK